MTNDPPPGRNDLGPRGTPLPPPQPAHDRGTGPSEKEPIFGDPRGSLIASAVLTIVSLVLFEFLAFGGAVTAGFGIIDSIRLRASRLVLAGNIVAFMGGFAASVAHQIP